MSRFAEAKCRAGLQRSPARIEKLSRDIRTLDSSMSCEVQLLHAKQDMSTLHNTVGSCSAPEEEEIRRVLESHAVREDDPPMPPFSGPHLPRRWDHIQYQ